MVVVDGTGSVRKPDSLMMRHAVLWDTETIRVQYPASILAPFRYDQSVQQGTVATEQAIRGVLDGCPNTHVHVLAHSQGSRIAGDAIANLATENVDTKRISADLYSDPRHPGSGIETVLPGLLPGVTMSGERGTTGEAVINQHCLQGDPICDMPEPLQEPWRIPDAALGFLFKHNNFPATQPEIVSRSEITPAPMLLPEFDPLPLPKLRDLIDYIPPVPTVPLPPLQLPDMNAGSSNIIPSAIAAFGHL